MFTFSPVSVTCIAILSGIISALLVRSQMRRTVSNALFWIAQSKQFLKHPPAHEQFFEINCEEDIRAYVIHPIACVFEFFNSFMATAKAMESTITLLSTTGFDVTLNGIILHYLRTVRTGKDFERYHQIVYAPDSQTIPRVLMRELMNPETLRAITKLGTAVGAQIPITPTVTASAAPSGEGAPSHTA